MKSATISVFEFNDPREFLTSLFRERKEQSSELKVKDWAQELGLEQPKLLVRLLKGEKPLRPSHLSWLAPALGLDPRSALYFRLLVLRSSAKIPEAIETLNEALDSVRRVHGVQQRAVHANQEVFGDWLCMAILSLIQIEPTLGSVDAIRSKLRFDVAAERVIHAVERLERAGLLRLVPGEGFELLQQAVSTPQDMPIQAVHQYYRQVNELAQESTQTPVLEREFQCFSVALPREDFGRIKELVRGWRQELAQLEQSKAPKSDTVYQANLQIFPLTQ